MMLRSVAVVAGLALGLMSEYAKASYIINAEQVGNAVVYTGSGSLDLSGLNFGTSDLKFNSTDSGFFAVDQTIEEAFVGDSPSNQAYNGAKQSGDFIADDTIFRSEQPTSAIGSQVGFQTLLTLGSPDITRIFVPTGYVSGTVLGLSTSTFASSTFASMNLKPGRYVLSWSSDELVFNVNVSAVPLPASAPMFGAALLGLAGLGFTAKRKKAAAAA